MALTELGVNDLLTQVIWILGSVFAVGWIAYVMYRSMANAWRDTRRAFSDLEVRKRGEQPPIRCFGCGMDLLDFVPPKDGNVYRFAGWHCENCGTVMDRSEHPI